VSDATHAHDEHHAHGGRDHVPHITPVSTYLKTYGALIFLTCLTVGVSYVNLGSSVNLGIALLIATIKATTVAALFMHLASDQKFNTAILLSSVVFLLIFITFTMFDTEYRNRVNIEDGMRVNMAAPFAVPTASASAGAAPSAAAPVAPPATPEKK
jgi:cytochrome c oxidase subunit 4